MLDINKTAMELLQKLNNSVSIRSKKNLIENTLLHLLLEQQAEQPNLRDQFAMAAIPHITGAESFTEIAETSYTISDAMLAERAKVAELGAVTIPGPCEHVYNPDSTVVGNKCLKCGAEKTATFTIGQYSIEVSETDNLAEIQHKLIKAGLDAQIIHGSIVVTYPSTGERFTVSINEYNEHAVTDLISSSETESEPKPPCVHEFGPVRSDGHSYCEFCGTVEGADNAN